MPSLTFDAAGGHAKGQSPCYALGMAAMTPVSLPISETQRSSFAAALGESFARTGFAVVADHGISPDVIARADRAARAFFALPDGVKRRYAVPEGAGQRGYTPFGIETAKGAVRADLKEFWHTGRRFPAGHPLAGTMPANVAMPEIPEFDSATAALFTAMDRFGLEILRAIALYLGLPLDFFDAKVECGNSILRLLHYPPVTADSAGVRAGAHEDINVITLLLGAEEAGLELRDREGRWLPIAPPPGCVVVNIGDMLQRLTNHVLPSTTHRVVNPPPTRAGIARYSMPFFQHFRPDYLIETLPSCITAAQPNRYPMPITADGYLRQRLAEIKLA